MSPEMLKEEPYNLFVDWWAFGVIVYEMLFGKSPFFNKNRNIMYLKIKNGKVAFPALPEISEDAKDFIVKLLEKDLDKRMKSPEEVLNHKWL